MSREPIGQEALTKITAHEAQCIARAKSVDGKFENMERAVERQFNEVKDAIKTMGQRQFRRELFFYGVAVSVIFWLANHAGIIGG